MRLSLTLPGWKILLRSAGQQSDRAVLDRRHVYILPSRAGILYALMLAGMLVGSINYSLNMGYVLAFWLMGLGLVAMLQTWRNLAYLQCSAGKAPPVFSGEDAMFTLRLSEQRGHDRHTIGLSLGKQSIVCDVAANQHTEVSLSMPTKHRGWLKPERFNIFTRWPLGLFHTWGYVRLEMACLVYPRPAPPGLPLPTAIPQLHPQGIHTSRGDEDFSGLRIYRPGDSMRRVDWKASAREQGLYTKEFEGQGEFAPWLDWDMTPGHGTEQKLSQLTRWVIDAHAAQQAFGLRLPHAVLPPASGEIQYRESLKMLALFGADK